VVVEAAPGVCTIKNRRLCWTGERIIHLGEWKRKKLHW
jgi:hypothetical protein